jgi:hypothetical protein
MNPLQPSLASCLSGYTPSSLDLAGRLSAVPNGEGWAFSRRKLFGQKKMLWTMDRPNTDTVTGRLLWWSAQRNGPKAHLDSRAGASGELGNSEQNWVVH